MSCFICYRIFASNKKNAKNIRKVSQISPRFESDFRGKKIPEFSNSNLPSIWDQRDSTELGPWFDTIHYIWFLSGIILEHSAQT